MLPSRRISLQCPVDNAASIRESLAERVGELGGDLAPANDYHFTVLHIGRPNEIYGAVASVADRRQATLDESTFLELFRNWVQVHSQTLRHETAVKAEGLVTLGERPPLSLVYKVVGLPLELRSLHSELLGSFARFLQVDLGAPDGAGLLRASPVFGFSGKSWVPHVSVGTIGRWVTSPSPAETVLLGPLQVRNAEVIGIPS